jgi:hypothetical protein
MKRSRFDLSQTIPVVLGVGDIETGAAFYFGKWRCPPIENLRR